MRTLRKHGGTVRALAYAPGGRLLASGGDDRTILLWDLETGSVRTTLSGHKDWVRGLAFSPDGRRLASAGWDDTLRMWHVGGSAGRERWKEEGLAGGVWCVAFAPDGWSLAAGCGDGEGSVYLWLLMNKEPKRHRAPRQQWPVNAIAYAPDGRLLATAGHDKTIRLRDPDFGQIKETLRRHTDWVRCLSFAPDGKLLASGGDDGTVRLWSVTSAAERLTLRGHAGTVTQVCFRPGGRSLLSAGTDQTVRVWDAATGREQGRFDWGVGRVFSLAVAPDGMTAAAGGERDIVVWDLDD
jgi:WD40 repeat protein